MGTAIGIAAMVKLKVEIGAMQTRANVFRAEMVPSGVLPRIQPLPELQATATGMVATA